jgi:hypothetical protein
VRGVRVTDEKARHAEAPQWVGPDDGPRGNERLTAWTGALLIVLLAVEGLTILRIHAFVVPHIAVGMVLVAAVLLKIGSTSYRFVRYYTGSAAYRRKGPPRPLLRVLGPLVVVSTVAVLASGIALLAFDPGSSTADRLLQLHKASFIVWFAVMTVHVLTYIWRIPGLLGAELQPSRANLRPAGFVVRLGLVVGACTAGIVLAVVTAHLGHSWTGPGRFDGPKHAAAR